MEILCEGVVTVSEKKEVIVNTGIRSFLIVMVSIVAEFLFLMAMRRWLNEFTTALAIAGLVNMSFWIWVHVDWLDRAGKELGLK